MMVDLRYVNEKSRAAFADFIDYESYDAKPLNVRCVEGGIIVPGEAGGIADSGAMLVESMAYRVVCPERFRRVPETYDVIDEEVFYLGCFESCWGHCITDNLKHLWPLCGSDAAKYRGMKWVFTMVHPEKPLPKNFIEVLGLLGIDEAKIVKVSYPTRFRKLYLPEECFYVDEKTCRRYYTKEYLGMIDSLMEKILNRDVCGSSLEKVYFTRTGWKKGNPDFGERHVEDAFKQKGYAIIRPETLSFSEMVRIINGCKCFASTEGSCAHNSLFMKKGSRLVVVRKADYICEYQIPINQMRNLDVVYVDANGTTLLESKSCPFSGPFFLYCNDKLSLLLGIPKCFPIQSWIGYFLCWAYLCVKKPFRKVVRYIKRSLRCNSL